MTSTSEAYLDIGGDPGRRWPVSYNECIMRDCPNCGVTKMNLCINPATRRSRKAPCILRMTQGWG